MAVCFELMRGAPLLREEFFANLVPATATAQVQTRRPLVWGQAQLDTAESPGGAALRLFPCGKAVSRYACHRSPETGHPGMDAGRAEG